MLSLDLTTALAQKLEVPKLYEVILPSGVWASRRCDLNTKIKQNQSFFSFDWKTSLRARCTNRIAPTSGVISTQYAGKDMEPYLQTLGCNRRLPAAEADRGKLCFPSHTYA